MERSLSIEETAWRTRIRPELLRALELEEFDSIGHQAFVRSHLASYARFLGIDPTEVVEQFEDQHEAPLPSSIEELDRQVRVAKKPPRPKWVVAALMSGAVLVAAAVVGLLGGQSERPVADPRTAPMPTVSEEPAGPPLPVPPAEARVRLRVEVTETQTVSIKVDGEQFFDGEMGAGEARMFRARRSVEILAADGGEVLLRLNGQDLGVAGAQGELFRGRFGPRGRVDD